MDTLRGAGAAGIAEEIAEGFALSIAEGTNPASLRAMNPADVEVIGAIAAVPDSGGVTFLNSIVLLHPDQCVGAAGRPRAVSRGSRGSAGAA